MKTSKLILITVIMFFASIGFSFTESTMANNELTPKNTIIKVHVLIAAQTPGFYEAVHQQVSPKFLILQTNKIYKFNVKYHGEEYLVYGYHKEWVYFFKEDLNIGGH